jgi:hypothetical protein
MSHQVGGARWQPDILLSPYMEMVEDRRLFVAESDRAWGTCEACFP